MSTVATPTPSASPSSPSTSAPTASPASPAPGKGQEQGPRRIDWRIRFGVLSLIWGFSFVFIKLGTDGFAPPYVSFGRMFFGALVLMAALLVTRQRLPRSARTWGHLTVAAFLCNALPFTLFAYAELTISTTLAGICNATTPLWGMVLSLVALSEDRPTRRRFAGLGLGFVGVLIVLGVWQGFSGQDPKGTGLALIAAASYAVGWIYVRRTLSGTGDSHLAMSGSQLLLGAVQLGVVAPLLSPLPTAFPTVPLLAVFALGALGTGLAFLLQYALVAEVGPTTATLTTYFIPVVSTTAGVALLGEGLSWNTPVGAVIVLAGAALTQGKGSTKAAGAKVVAAGSEPAKAQSS
ncbi:EamA family transporter [Streptomyces cinnamoneus]|uniref:EamA family transporter n=1 Tax=Streptomyces cinnamoneus TaxID=53446 RepID=A0A2G1XM11_STRCJ|nr:DMT family transporter [Streptomyces cinnamoneus]PHQ52263.1 EamA family transporter [Streptomyces cinnamoneus]PPT12195.1 EamA/RhaT family transporter [Streptomyces cinnamoneus]